MFWIHVHGRREDGSIETEQIATAFPMLGAATEYAETLLENHTFDWGKATAFTITDEFDYIVLRGSIHSGEYPLSN